MTFTPMGPLPSRTRGGRRRPPILKCATLARDPPSAPCSTQDTTLGRGGPGTQGRPSLPSTAGPIRGLEANVRVQEAGGPAAPGVSVSPRKDLSSHPATNGAGSTEALCAR